MTRPTATLRLQFHRGYPFSAAEDSIGYFAALGISHIYASPIFAAQPGSSHGYDVVDPNLVNPELGGEAALRRLVARLHDNGMGLIVDFVPNHMGIGAGNRWWRDVLTHGRASRYASFFDIDWASRAIDARGKVLLPVLAEPLADALARNRLQLARGTDGKLEVDYAGQRFPLSPATRDAALSVHSADDWHALLERQHYRLAWWPLGRDALNWRRFFDITTLAAIRVDDPAVFDATHALLLRLFGDGLIDGVRIDHVDGLADPGAYCRRLARALRRAGHRQPYVIVEKILMPGETLDPAWGTDGTTGYDFMNDVAAVLHDDSSAQALAEIWREHSGDARSLAAHVVAARAQLLDETFGSEIARLMSVLDDIASREPSVCDVSPAAVERCVRALARHFPVYRAYPAAGPRGAIDEAVFAAALQRALTELHPLDRPVLAQLDRWLGAEAPRRRRRRRDAQIRFAQVTAPLAAKSVEDTVGYRWARALSRNDVGADLATLGMSVAAFHAANAARGATFPRTLLTTATHDHKRGEDVRARLAVLSEVPERYAAIVSTWRDDNAPYRATLDTGFAPSPADESMLYQTLIGAWPAAWLAELAGGTAAPVGIDAFCERIAAWQLKAIREAKLRTSWLAPDDAYETGCRRFLDAILHAPSFVAELDAFVRGIAAAGALNGLVQTFLRMTSPGVPDLYQGCEFWDESLVDPDNRRPVDFAARQDALERMSDSSRFADLDERLANWHDGRIKLRLIHDTLAIRHAHARCFEDGSYVPLPVTGVATHHAIAFARCAGDRKSGAVVAVASRLAARWLTGRAVPRIPPHDWRDTAILLSPAAPSVSSAIASQATPGRPVAWRDALTSSIHAPSDGMLRLRDVLRTLPVALLVPAG
ncbi:malto-oligosyltrehalose synthase [Burkholderia sp. BCC1977]|uniref:malto-oligosyltrehalose synthase n=1 Tax=Burkholderia sp. BCC1977 TaxID=2817440 RepID=UPI002ABE2C3F|nr:malto-oligosyltrehalose synthase [Burkholderia sp. BCC1977]